MAEPVRVVVYEKGQESRAVWAVPGQTVWDVLASGGWETGGYCGGRGTCGKCQVKVTGDVSAPAVDEADLLDARGVSSEYRLACRCRLHGAAEVYIEGTKRWVAALGQSASSTTGEFSPRVRSRKIQVSRFQPQQPADLRERVQQAVGGYDLNLTTSNWDMLTALDQGEELELYAITIGPRLVSLSPKPDVPVLGAILDLGTTTLFTEVFDLSRGISLSSASAYNPQRAYGADVLARISYALERPTGLSRLHTVLIEAVNRMLGEMSVKGGWDVEDIYELVVVGNPVMLHLLLGLEIRGFARSPFVGVFAGETEAEAGKLGIDIHTRGVISLLPQIGGFIGSDTVAGLLATDYHSQETFLFIDIGTNGEMVLHHQGQWWACSAAAGPAFEGGNLTRGMPAGSGAVDRVWVQDGQIGYNVLGTERAQGICGSGVVDLVAALLDLGWLDSSGLLVSDSGVGQGAEFVLVPAFQAVGGQSVAVTQDDIRQLQLAKGAMRAAVDIMLERAGLAARDLERVFLAGAFGNYLRPDSILRIGLLPYLDAGKIKPVGNAAAGGAVLALFSQSQWEEARSLAPSINYIELANEADFQEVFLRSLNFPEPRRNGP
jgi:uncharacterized 2Fe-2S/4Fe-4S cluster protein (DUF4445 family)